jgi:hypothetical protein
MRVSFSAVQGAKPMAIKAPNLRFGRDALFERNDRFERIEPTEQQHVDALQNLLDNPPKEPNPKKAADNIAAQSRFLYDDRGRIRGKGALPLALRAAQKEYDLLQLSPAATPVEKGLAGVKLANAQIAQDIEDPAVFKLLDQSLKALDSAGYKPTPGNADPVYIHGLYNRGSHYMNNDVYKETAMNNGPEETILTDVGHEGLGLNLEEPSPIIRHGIKKLQEGLPYLDKAVTYSKGLKDDKIAVAEYLSAKGEAIHLLSHLDYYNGETWSRQGLDVFKEALAELDTVPVAQQTPRHLKLAEKIGAIKIPHMCSHQHRPMGAARECQALDLRSQARLTDMQGNGIQQPPETPNEEFARKLEEEMSKMPRIFFFDPFAR